jgi:hypothetical protein
MTHRTIDFRYAPWSVWTSICRPDDPHKSLVREDGALLYGFTSVTFQAWYFERVLEFSIDCADQPVRVEQHTETAKVPVVITTLEYPKAILELRAFGHQHNNNLRTDVVLWQVRAKDDVDEFLTAFHVEAYARRLAFVGRQYAPVPAPAHVFFAVDVGSLGATDRWASATRLIEEDTQAPPPGDVAFVSMPHRLNLAHTRGFRPATGLSTAPLLLRAGESASGAVLVPINHQQVEDLSYDWAKAALEKERHYWNSLQLMHTAISVPDAAVMDMLTACARNILQAREIEDGLPVYKVGPTVYRNLFVVDGHFLLEAAQYLGDSSAASQAINTLLRRARPNGAIFEMEHHTKETGISIATLVRQTELLGDDARLRDLWEVVRGAVKYIEGLRQAARQLPPDDPCCNLLPRAFGDGGIGGDRGEYTTVLWTLFGLKSAVDAAERLELAKDHAHFKSVYESLLSDFRNHAVQHTRQLPDGTPYLPIKFDNSSDHHWIPDYPGEVPAWSCLKPQSATWALCQAIYPGEVFTPDDPLVQNLLTLFEQVDDDEGIPAETGWLPYRALWSYHASFAAHVWLYAGRPDKAVDYLYDFANHASTTRVWREEQSFKATGNGQLFGDMPHNWASAEFIRLLRNLLIFEHGQQLKLFPGLPSEWLCGEVSVEQMPTRFGLVNLNLTRADDGSVKIVYSRRSLGHREPKSVQLYLHNMTDVHLQGVSTTPINEAIELAGLTHAEVTARLR